VSLAMQSAARKIHFCYGHRVMNHESKCASLHGHNGVIWVHVTPIVDLDSIGRVIDFSVVKSVIGGWVDDNWDHTMIICKEDLKTIDLLAEAPSFKPIFILDKNPTAENLASYLLWSICPKLLKGKGVIVHKVVFWETENCYVEQTLDPTSSEVIGLYR
jgi:6-pyruvoyltetrahydropterin/6-carboxytetrahydropterin synthase